MSRDGKKAEALREIGNLVTQQIAPAIANQVLSQNGPGYNKELSEFVDAALKSSTNISLNVRRRDEKRGSYVYLGTIPNIPPAILNEPGLEPFIAEYSGGGDYQIIIKASGIPEKQVMFSIAGESLDAKDKRPEVPKGMNGMPLGPMPGMNMPFGAYGSYPWLQQQPQSEGKSVEIMGGILAAMLAGQQNRTSPEVDILKAQLEEAKAQAARAHDDARLAMLKAEQDAKMRELELKFAAAAATPPKAGFIEALPALLGTLGPVALSFMSEQQKRADAQVAANREMLMSMQNQGKDTQETMLKIMVQNMEAQSRQAAPEDRFAKLTETMGSMMGTTVGMLGTMMQSGLLGGGDNKPPWVDVAEKALDTLGVVASTMFAPAESGGGEISPEQAAAMGMLPAPQDDSAYDRPAELPPMVRGDVAQLAQPVAQPMAQVAQPESGELEVPPTEAEMMSEEDDEDEESEPMQILLELPSGQTIDLATDPAMMRIFDLWTGATQEEWEKRHLQHEIAYRVWKHANSGVPAAKWWYEETDAATAKISDLVTAVGATFEPNRVALVRIALHNIRTQFNSGMSPADFIKTYEIKQTPPKLA